MQGELYDAEVAAAASIPAPCGRTVSVLQLAIVRNNSTSLWRDNVHSGHKDTPATMVQGPKAAT